MDSFWEDHLAILLSPENTIFAFALTLGLLVISSVSVAIILILIPSDYFSNESKENWFFNCPPAIRLAALLTKNLIGAMLLPIGCLMLFTPGQGALTILLGVMLLDFPYKKKLERRIISQPKIILAINKLRARYNKLPLDI